MYKTFGLTAAAFLAVATLAGCASSTSSSVPNPAASASFSSAAAARSSAAAAFSSATAAAASSVASEPCTTKSCIVQDAQQSLPGAVAEDESVITKAKCYKSTVKHHPAAGLWTVECTAYYSDGSNVSGIANLLLAQNKITFQPTNT